MRTLLTALLILIGGIATAQIGTQWYLANDSCQFYVPDYSQAVFIQDNCCDSSTFIQVPNSGTLLNVGDEVKVTLYAIDCNNNQRSMSFDIVVIDNVPPEFYYDSTLFTSLGQYQNDVRTWHFWTNTEPDTTKPLPIYYSQSKTARDRVTMAGSAIHDAFYRNDEYYKMSLFMAQSTYRITDMLMAISKVGTPQGKLHVEIWQLNMSDTSLFYPVCGAQIDLDNIVGRVSSDSQNLPAEELIWHTIDLSDGFLVRGGWYAIRTYCTGIDDEQVIWNTSNYDINNEDPYQFLMYSYDNEETYGINLTSSYMYQIWGIDLN